MKFSISYLVNCGLVAAGPGESITEISLWIDIARSSHNQVRLRALFRYRLEYSPKRYFCFSFWKLNLVRQTFVDLSHGFLSGTKQAKPWGYIYTHEDCPIGKYSLHLIRWKTLLWTNDLPLFQPGGDFPKFREWWRLLLRRWNILQ